MIHSIHVEAERLGESVAQYLRLSGRTIEETLEKQGAKFAANLRRELSTIAPKKGSIRTSRLAAFKQGEGIKVRDSVRVKVFEKYKVSTSIADGSLRMGQKSKATNARGQNVQALLATAEINVREKGIGFLSVSAKYPAKLNPGSVSATSKFGLRLSTASLSLKGRDGSLVFTWGQDGRLSVAAAKGLSTAQAQNKAAAAISQTTEDILVYVNRKIQEDIRKADLANPHGSTRV